MDILNREKHIIYIMYIMYTLLHGKVKGKILIPREDRYKLFVTILLTKSYLF